MSSTKASLLTFPFPKCFISTIINIPDITNANPSANGPAYNTPISPNKLPNVTIAGIKNKICLDNDSIALFALFPIAWKNIPDGICTPLQITNIKYVLNAIHANSMYSSFPLPNIDISLSGIV